jgi:signal transduction histidine kinase
MKKTKLDGEPVHDESLPKGHASCALHREKLAALGELTAGLMHELHNPGAAAARASSQLRENLLRLQELSLRFSRQQKNPAQMDCMHRLLESALHRAPAPALSSIDQADAEEAMAAWLTAAGVENAYIVAPALTSIGFQHEELECARKTFAATGLSDTLNWLEALVSSATLVSVIEESIARMTELAMAVKEFAHDGGAAAREIDVHASLQSSLTLLGHKLRERQVAAVKCFSAAPALVLGRSGALSQIWTNLIDNAIDASLQGAQIEIATWNEAASDGNPHSLIVSILDHGVGIAPESLTHIFEAFYTTKPQGHGTGLGLEIVHRIVTQELGGSIAVDSQPGQTRFVVRLPLPPGA